MDNQPVVAIVGQQARSALGARYQQEVDLVALFKDVASDYVAIGTACRAGPPHGRPRGAHRADEALRHLHHPAQRSAVMPTRIRRWRTARPIPASAIPAESKVPESQGLRDAAKVLNEGKKVAMLVGAGCLGATDEVHRGRGKLGAGVAKALLGKAAVAGRPAFVTGGLGLLGTKPTWDLMKDCDTLLMVGSCFPYSEFLPKPGSARGVQIDIEGDNLSLRYPMEVNLVGDSAATLRALLPLLEQKTRYELARTRSRTISPTGGRCWKSRAMNTAEPINPQRVFWELSPRLPDNCIVTADSGSVANWYARDLKIRRGMKGSLSGASPRWGPRRPMRWPQRWPIPSARDRHASATAPCR